MKKRFFRVFLAFLLAAGGAFALTGCQSTDQDSAVPWSRPASWEGQVPGMGSP